MVILTHYKAFHRIRINGAFACKGIMWYNKITDDKGDNDVERSKDKK